MNREPVDWQFVESASVQIWTWTTPHFEVRIFGEGTERRLYQWIINDRSNGADRMFEEGSSQSFHDAQDTVLEIIAKSYPQKLGYQQYAGALGTTYKLASGMPFDFGPLEGAQVVITYEDNDKKQATAIGALSLTNWAIRVRTDNTASVKIPPHRIVDIQSEGQRMLEATAAAALPGPSAGPTVIGGRRARRSSSGKVFNEPYRKGCTGKPGMIPNTVIHTSTDAPCPIHGV